MKIFILFSLFGLILLSSCKEENSNCKYKINDVLRNKNTDKVKLIKKSKNGTKEFLDKGKESIEGGYYTFDSNDNLMSYRYLIDSSQFIYSIKYDSLGNPFDEEGEPLVHQLGTELNDSLQLKFYFYILGLQYEKVTFWADNIETPLKLEIDSTLSNVIVATYSIGYPKGKIRIKGKLNVSYSFVCTKKDTKSFSRDIDLEYSPH